MFQSRMLPVVLLLIGAVLFVSCASAPPAKPSPAGTPVVSEEPAKPAPQSEPATQGEPAVQPQPAAPEKFMDKICGLLESAGLKYTRKDEYISLSFTVGDRRQTVFIEGTETVYKTWSSIQVTSFAAILPSPKANSTFLFDLLGQNYSRKIGSWQTSTISSGDLLVLIAQLPLDITPEKLSSVLWLFAQDADDVEKLIMDTDKY